jgi:hypothetical protein
MQFNLEHNGEEITVVHQVDSYGSPIEEKKDASIILRLPI